MWPAQDRPPIWAENKKNLEHHVDPNQTCKARGQYGCAQKDHTNDVSSQPHVPGGRLVVPCKEALQGKAHQYAILGRCDEVALSVEELCGRSCETMAIKGA